MNGGDVAAIVVSVVLVIIAVGLLLTLSSVMRTLRLLRETIEEFRRQTLPLVNDLRSTVTQTNAELTRVDGLLESAESLTGTLSSASRLAYLAFSNPLVKLMAFSSGTARAARRLRRRG